MKFLVSTFLATFVITSLATIPAFAKEKRLIEEVIVTAEYVKKSAQDTPISISALDNEFIEDMGIVDIDDLLVFVPSLSRDLLDLTIRGVGRNFRTLGGDVGVPVYYNGVYTEEAIGLGSENAYYDLNRIEVLRGPQGTLYGRNAIGGVVNYVSNSPTREFFAEVKAKGGAYDTGDFHAAISGPLIKDLINYRLVGVSVNQGPDRTSRAAPGQTPISDTGGFEDNNLSLMLEITPTDNLDIMLRFLDRYYRVVPRVPVLIGEGTGDRTQRSSAVCFPEGTDCFNSPTQDFFNRPPLNPNANQNLPISGNGFGEDLDNIAYPDFKPDYGYAYNTYTTDTQWHFGHNNYTLRFLGGHTETEWGNWERAIWSAPGGRNTCVPPMCLPGGEGEQISRYKTLSFNPLRQSSGELQLISNFDGPFNFVSGVFYLKLERELYFEASDDAQLGLYTKEPSWGLINPDDFFAPPRGIGRHNLGGNDAVEFNAFGGTRNGAWFWMDTEIDTYSFASYVQGSYEFNDEWELTAGIRWSNERKTGREWRWIYNEVNAEFFGFESLAEFNRQITTDPVTGEYNGDPFRLAGFPIEIIDSLKISDSWEKLTWRLALSWQPSQDTLAYASATTGFRAGGFNLGLHQEFPYDEEEILAYEIGVKTDLFNGRLRLNISAYFYNYDDHQVFANAPVRGDVIGCNLGCFDDTSEEFLFFNAVQNIREARNWGTELEAIWRATDGITVGFLHSYMETEITSDFIITRESNEWSAFFSNERVNLKGGELNRAPRNKFTVWLNYQYPLGDIGRLSFLTSYAYTDEQYFNVLNDRINEAPSYQRWDFRATWDSAAGKYRVSAFVKNISDELGIVELRAGENFTRNADTTKPRIWGIEFRMRFGNWSADTGAGQIDGPAANR